MSHYYSEKQESDLNLRKIINTVRGFQIELFLGSGIFSTKKIDNGSRLLAEKMVIKNNDKVLDLGCGAGVIGLIASKLTMNQIIMTDINERACKLSRMNTRGIKNIKVKQGDIYEPVKNEMFDVVLLNPPQTAGKKLCFEMIEKAKDHLNKGSNLQLVARHSKGGKHLSEKMEKIFGNVKALAKKGGYRVYYSKK